jgi:hypothetical protein
MRVDLSLLIRTAAAMIALAGLAAPAGAQDKGGAWRQMSPQERQQMWRNMPPEQRNRTIQERQRRMEQGQPVPRDHYRQLSPEERTQLREQIREANRDWRSGPGKGRGDRK